MKSQSSNFRSRFNYALLLITVIILGLLSRKITVIPLIAGDMLYAVLMFFLIRFLFIRLNYLKAALISLSICYLIELGQLCHAVWIDQIRNTTLGSLVLGRGFLWSDMAAYTIGTAACALVFYTQKTLLKTPSVL